MIALVMALTLGALVVAGVIAKSLFFLIVLFVLAAIGFAWLIAKLLGRHND